MPQDIRESFTNFIHFVNLLYENFITFLPLDFLLRLKSVLNQIKISISGKYTKYIFYTGVKKLQKLQTFVKIESLQ